METTKNNPTQSAISTRQHITVKKRYTIEEYKSVVYLTRDYYDAMRHKKDLPKEKLPPLDVLIEANNVVSAYLDNVNLGLSLKLFNCCLPLDTVCAVWFFANEPTLNVRIGNYQLLALNHK